VFSIYRKTYIRLRGMYKYDSRNLYTTKLDLFNVGPHRSKAAWSCSLVGSLDLSSIFATDLDNTDA